ncbi:unnamed protein product [Rhizophagus irregularis]|nr:unnamed protein product [Rhizophagus irregularis]
MSNIEIYDNGQEAGPFGLLGLPDEIMREEMDDEQEAGPSELLGLPDEIMREEMDDDGMEFPKRNYNFLTKKLPMQSTFEGS